MSTQPHQCHDDCQERKNLLSKLASEVAVRREREKYLLQAMEIHNVELVAKRIVHQFRNDAQVAILKLEQTLDIEEVSGNVAKSLTDIKKQMLKWSNWMSLIASAREGKINHKETENEAKHVEINEFIRKIYRILAYGNPTNINLECDLRAAGSFRQLNILVITESLIHLVKNAQEAIAGVLGQIIIRTEDSVDGRYVLISIIDTGPGVPLKYRSRLFEPFFSTKEKRTNAGCSLYSARKSIRKLGGNLEFHPNPAGGAHFTVELPRAYNKQGQVVSFLKKKAVNGTVLVVDDEPSLTSLIREHLDRAGFHVLTATMAEDALSLLERYPNKINAIVTDLMMPGMSGIEFVEKVREKGIDSPIVISTGTVDVNPKQSEILKDPKLSLLQKPYRPLELIALINNLISVCKEKGESTSGQ